MKRKLKIIHLNTAKTWRGGERQTLFLVTGLKQIGHYNIIVCPPNSPLEHQAKSKNINVINLPLRSELDIFSGIQLSKIIKKYNIDILHSHTSHAASIAFFAGLFCPNVFKIAHRRVDFHLKKNPFNRIKYHQGIDHIISISHGIEKVIRDDGIPKEKITIIPSAIDLNRFNNLQSADYLYSEFSLDRETPIICNVAALADHKDQKTLLTAMPLVLQKIPNAKLLIVGEGKLGRELQELQKQLGLGDAVIFTGFRKDVLSFLSIANLFVLSSHLEGLGSSLLDAMAMGLPIVATNTGGIPEIIKHNQNGLLVPIKKPQELADGIIKLLKDKKLANKMGVNGKEMVKNFAVERMVVKTEQLYWDLLGIV